MDPSTIAEIAIGVAIGYLGSNTLLMSIIKFLQGRKRAEALAKLADFQARLAREQAAAADESDAS